MDIKNNKTLLFGIISIIPLVFLISLMFIIRPILNSIPNSDLFLFIILILSSIIGISGGIFCCIYFIKENKKQKITKNTIIGFILGILGFFIGLGLIITSILFYNWAILKTS